MLGECNEMLAHQRATPRWKEWIPLVTQQLRLRNLIQVIAYNVSIGDKMKNESRSKDTRLGKIKTSFYYTLHLTTMSAPFYTSEKLENENPKWAEIEIGDAVNSVNASVGGIVVRLWVHRSGGGSGSGSGGSGGSGSGGACGAGEAASGDQVVTVWGVCFSGLAYLGPRPAPDPRALHPNTIVFHMRGGYFTAPHCWPRAPDSDAATHTTAAAAAPERQRRTAVRLPAADVKPSYSVPLVSRLHTIQQAIKKQRAAAAALRERIGAGAAGGGGCAGSGAGGGGGGESAALRRLLARGRPPAQALRQRAVAVRRQTEDARCRVGMLRGERTRAAARVQRLKDARQRLLDANQDRGLELMNNYQELHKDMECLKDRRKLYIESRDSYLTTNAQLIFRQKQLMSKLSQIYPVQRTSDGEYSICGVNLPNSEDFAGKDEIMISISLGYVAHVLQMISIFLQVPLRYPIIHFGSWSKIVDHIVEKIPEKDREFPLFSRGKDKLQFNYGVYLLNKNVSQLRWYCGLPTQDLRTTLPNLCGLLHIQMMSVTEGPASVPRRPPAEAPPPTLPSLPLPPPPPPPPLPPPSGPRVARAASGSAGVVEVEAGLRAASALSLSLDKGLDEFQLAQRLECVQQAASTSASVAASAAVGAARGGSEPSLAAGARASAACAWGGEEEGGDEARKCFLRRWQAGGPAPLRADEEAAEAEATVAEAAVKMLNNDVEEDGTKIEEEIQRRTSEGAKVEKDSIEPRDGTKDHVEDERPADDIFANGPETKEEIVEVGKRKLVDDNGSVVIHRESVSVDTAASVETFPLWDDDPRGKTDPFCILPSDEKHSIPASLENPLTVVGGKSEAEVSISEKELQEETRKRAENDSVVGSRRETLDISHSENNTMPMEETLFRPNTRTNDEVEEGKILNPGEAPGSRRNPGMSKKRSISESAMEGLSAEETEHLSMLEEALSLEAVSGLLERSVLVDSAFASVASRTEALASRTGSFNLVRSRHSSALDD